jgi:hypothetical protein
MPYFFNSNSSLFDKEDILCAIFSTELSVNKCCDSIVMHSELIDLELLCALFFKSNNSSGDKRNVNLSEFLCLFILVDSI